jgi:hypothetical protein
MASPQSARIAAISASASWMVKGSTGGRSFFVMRRQLSDSAGFGFSGVSR